MRRWLPVLLVLATSASVQAAPAGEQAGPPPFQVDRPAPDFLFGRPRASIGVHGSWIFSRAGSDWYDFVSKQLTIDRGAFSVPAVGFDAAYALTPRVDVVASFDFSRKAMRSEYRDYVDNNRLPIEQSTELSDISLTGGVKFLLRRRGLEIGRLAWVPRTVVPYVGAGAGMYWFHLTQFGDFVDFADLSVFSSYFESRGWAPSAHVFGGTEVRLTRRIFVNVEARYHWASEELGQQWIGFEPLDMSGLHLTTGVNVSF